MRCLIYYKSDFIPFSSCLPQTEKKKSCQKLTTIGGACTLYGAFFVVSSRKRKKITRPHHQNGYSSILPVTVTYLLLNLGLSFSELGKVSYTYDPLCFLQTYPCYINHHSGLTVFEISNVE